jgi:1-deoxy-D-xylulose-5-phosphate synthase
MTPADELECRRMLQAAYLHPGPAAVRYPRGTGPGVPPGDGLLGLPIGQGELRRQGSGVALLAFGSPLQAALQAAQTLDATVASMRFAKPLDERLVQRLASTHRLLVTLEENTVLGGAGGAVSECVARLGLEVPVLNLGLPDRFVEHGERAELLAECALDAAGILAAITSHPRWAQAGVAPEPKPK